MPDLDQMPTQIEKVVDSGMGRHKSLRLLHRLEPPHTPLSHPRRFVRLLSPVILILLSTVDRSRNQLPMSNTVTSQFVGHDLPGFTAMVSQ